MLYTFRILLDYEQDVFRDIQIKGEQNFIELHKAIQNAFGFDNSQISSFYLSDDNWNKGDEISMMDMAGEQGEGTSYSMSDTTIELLAQEEGQKLVYVSDFFLMWCFFVELVKISEPAKGFEYPSIALSVGESPEQYSKDGDIEFEVDEKSDDSDREEDIFDGFDDFDDYQ
ncbi:MAG: hypothetical protein JKY53_10380 [Flavobacteriales bacterium]|nr:hypothetical protein [Flavobacteriales bacterium]